MVLYLFYMFMEQLIKQSKYSIFSANQGNWRQNCTSPTIFHLKLKIYKFYSVLSIKTYPAKKVHVLIGFPMIKKLGKIKIAVNQLIAILNWMLTTLTMSPR